jgi:hypothetical protein
MSVWRIRLLGIDCFDVDIFNTGLNFSRTPAADPIEVKPMHPFVQPLIYMAAGLILLALYWSRNKGYARLQPDLLPYLSSADFAALKTALHQSIERMLFLALAFLFLAAVIVADWHEDFRMFAVLVVAIVFCLNIGPRHRLGKIVFHAGLDPAELKKHGIRL